MPFGLEPWLFWTLLAIVLFIAEIVTPGFFLACLGVGVALAVVPTLLDLSFAWQLACFSVGSLLAFVFLRPLFHKPQGEQSVSGVQRLMGKQIRLAQDLPADYYIELPIDGDVWRVAMQDKSFVPAGSVIKIVGVEGITLLAELASHA